ncbi:MAG: hypothetical protein FJX20_02290 [Alphaproteobacteria bacterium]|nr:hypothetical protein [Alphaproteobacteria bacterium]
MRGLVLAQSVNKAGINPENGIGYKDATGVFVPGAKYFSNLWGLDKPVLLDDVDDRNKMLKAIEKSTMLDVIAYFGHGDRNRIGSANIGMGDLKRLSDAIRTAAAPGCQVIFYACQLGGRSGFCEKLAGMLGGTVTFWGHSCSGHGNTNPYVTRYPFAPDVDAHLINPASPLFYAWTKLIKSNSDIWARFPFMTKDEVESKARDYQNGMPVLSQLFGSAAEVAVGMKKPKKKAA